MGEEVTTTEMTRTSGNGTRESSFVPMDQAQIMRYLNLNPADVKTQALLLPCDKYGFDPLLKHVVLITGNMYVTRDGLMHVAHDSRQLDGLQVEQLPDTESHFVAVASVWRKDMSRPFRFQGRYPKNGGMAKHGPEMAEKVAVCRALRHAFDVSLCSREETWEEDRESAPAPSPSRQVEQAPAPTVSPLARAISLFAEAAIEQGQDVTSETGKGKYGKRKCILLFTAIQNKYGTNWDDTNPEHWEAATVALPNFVADMEAQEAAQVESDTQDADFTDESTPAAPGPMFTPDEVPAANNPAGRI